MLSGTFLYSEIALHFTVSINLTGKFPVIRWTRIPRLNQPTFVSRLCTYPPFVIVRKLNTFAAGTATCRYSHQIEVFPSGALAWIIGFEPTFLPMDNQRFTIKLSPHILMLALFKTLC